MSFNQFTSRVFAIAKRAGENVDVRISRDDDKGRFIARFPDNTTIIAHESSARVTVKFGSGHVAMATI